MNIIKELRCDKCDYLIAKITIEENTNIGEIYISCPEDNCDGCYEE